MQRQNKHILHYIQARALRELTCSAHFSYQSYQLFYIPNTMHSTN